MKIGRNDMCPCGSQMKYKKCCLKNELVPVAAPSLSFERRQLQKACETLTPLFLSLAKERLGEDFLMDAWDEFWLWDQEIPDFSDNIETFMDIFMSFTLYTWEPLRNAEKPVIGSVAFWYVMENFDSVRSDLKTHIFSVLNSPFTFFEVVSVEQKKGVTVRDLMRNELFDVEDYMASLSAKPGSLVFGRVLNLVTTSVFFYISPLALPPSAKVEIFLLAEKLQKKSKKLTERRMADYSAVAKIRDLYVSYALSSLNPKPPRLTNTDGDDLKFLKLVFEVTEKPSKVLRKLSLLSVNENISSAMENFEPKASENFSFTWTKSGNKTHSSWDSTVLGHLTLTGNLLTAEVNSENRAKRLKGLVKKLAGAGVRFLRMEQIKFDQSKMQMMPSMSEEFEKIRTTMIEKHYENWADQKLPVLQNKTPREALKLNRGEEIVEALIFEMEKSNERLGKECVAFDFNKIRFQLGLKVR